MNRVGQVLLVLAALACTACATPRDGEAPLLLKAELAAMKDAFDKQKDNIARTSELAWRLYDSLCPKVPPDIWVEPGLKLECFYEAVPESRQTAVFLIATDDSNRTQLVAIRGTANLADVEADLRMGYKHDAELGVNVHEGFGDFARAIRSRIKQSNLLRPGYAITLTGHSLGAAGAVLVGLYLYKDDHNVAAIYTYGQPKVFGNAGTTAWPAFADRLWRIVSCNDVFSLQPIVGDYQHMGRSFVLSDDGHYWMPGHIEFERSFARVAAQSASALAHAGKIDHQMSAYMPRLERFLAAPKVAYPVPGQCSPLEPSSRNKVAARP
jgi:hypothetical protein